MDQILGKTKFACHREKKANFFFYLLIAAARRYIKESFFHKVIFLQFSDSKFIKFPLDEVQPNRKWAEIGHAIGEWCHNGHIMVQNPFAKFQNPGE